MSQPSEPPRLSHVDAAGAARMVDIADKAPTRREARAEAFLRAAPATIAAALDGTAPKGDVIAVARLAGIMAAKHTADLIPLCHPLLVSAVSVDIGAMPDAAALRVESRVRIHGATGVEMEALTAAAVACLTLYDMLKAIDRTMSIEGVRVIEKRGGKSAWPAA